MTFCLMPPRAAGFELALVSIRQKVRRNYEQQHPNLTATQNNRDITRH